MRSPDDTYYNINRLHVIFAISSALLAGVTAWMFAVDHQRHWKEYQREYRDRIQPWLAESQLDQQEDAEFAEKEAALRAALQDAATGIPAAETVEQFAAVLRAAGDESDAAAVEETFASLRAEASAERRAAFLETLESIVGQVDQQRDELDRQRRVERASFDEARSLYEIAAGQGAPAARLAELRKTTDDIQARMESLAGRVEDLAVRRQQLAELVASIRSDEDAAQESLRSHLAQVDRIRRTLANSPQAGARAIVRMPFVDSFGRSLAVEQIWLPELTIDYNFRRVARFDRCTTCHLGIERVEPGTADQPAISGPRRLVVQMATPEVPPPEPQFTVGLVYGLTLAPRGILDPARPTVSAVDQRSAAARAGLFAGDAIEAVDGVAVTSRDEAVERLLKPRKWGISVELQVVRGLPQPYCGHPRPDLFVGSGSPHPASQYGCTVCHGGQGSATDFALASHSPDASDVGRSWAEQYGWFRNKHWDLAMLPSRFSESGCLQCHHDVTDLEATDRYPDAPAPKLLAGYHLVRQYGCFGCHEFNGFDPAGEPIGPDLRLEPPVTEAAEQVAALVVGSAEDRRLADAVVADPENWGAREGFVRAVEARQAGDRPLAARPDEIQRLLDILRSKTLRPGTMRKVGPGLRQVADRLGEAVLDRWIANPAVLRATTRMPRLFGLHEHLQGEELRQTQVFEAVEIEGVRSYLLAASQAKDYVAAPAEVTEEPSAERGKELFVRRGCVACHRHGDVPEGTSTVGPELTGLGSMITAVSGRVWLTSWLRDPALHSPRTPMPNPLLAPQPLGTDGGDGRPRWSDPAADLAAYLLASRDEEPVEASPAVEESQLDALVLTYLGSQFPAGMAQQFLAGGIPADRTPADLGDAEELRAPITRQKKLRYVGRRTIRRRGCFGCHDVPGFEGAQVIGPALSDWGRKQESLLAFEQVGRFLQENPPGGADGSPADLRFYQEAIADGLRTGFLWQKLRAPRSFDFRKAEHKGYTEQLTMGRFSFTPVEREQIMTFVLGMVADPPSKSYLPSPDGRTMAVTEGRKVLDRYGCDQCHTLKMARWRFRYDPESWEGPPASETFDFARPVVGPAEIARSLVRDRTGWVQAEVVGEALIDTSGETIEDEDDDGNPVYVFSLWEPAVINGQVWPVGVAQVPVAKSHLVREYPRWGGAFAQLLYPYAAEESATAWLEAWGKVPPPLVREGARVRPEWLYSYLLDPAPIRPSILLRMPRYRLSAGEAAALVEYFAAAAGADFPYIAAAQPSDEGAASHVRAALMDQAMRLVTDRKTYCAKCHLIGDYKPGGESQTILAPNLAEAGRRIRADHMRRWLADPKSVLPYTGMPVNFPPVGPPMGQDLLPGSSAEQLQAVADLLLSYTTYLENHTSIRAMIDSAAGPPPGEAADQQP
ncbi:MAG: PDZ domain-containing protein [Thermoguttaceae bacterium]